MIDQARALRLLVDAFDGEPLMARFVDDALGDDDVPGVGTTVAAVTLDLGGYALLAVDPRRPFQPLEVSVSLPADERALDIVDAWFGSAAREAVIRALPGGNFAPPEDARKAAGRLAVLDWVRASMPVSTSHPLWALEETVLACEAAGAGLGGRAHALIAALPTVVDEIALLLDDAGYLLWERTASSAKRYVEEPSHLRGAYEHARACLRRARDLVGPPAPTSAVFWPRGRWSAGWDLCPPGVLDPRERTVVGELVPDGLRVEVATLPATGVRARLWARAVTPAGGPALSMAELGFEPGRISGVIPLPMGMRPDNVVVDIASSPQAEAPGPHQRAIGQARRAGFRAMFHERRHAGGVEASRWWEASANAWATAGLRAEAEDAGLLAARSHPSTQSFLAERLVDPDLLDGPPA